MILGLGTDLCDITRIEKTLARFGMRFVKRICRESEYNRVEKSRTIHNRIRRYAQLFAAKEACAKALGTGLKRGVFWRDMEVCPFPSGKPTLKLHAGALKRAEALTPKGMKPVPEISLTDEAGLAQAVVILFAIPLETEGFPRAD